MSYFTNFKTGFGLWMVADYNYIGDDTVAVSNIPASSELA
jgi:hypothetical protein